MSSNPGWQDIVASSLDWEQAHASLESATKNLAPELRGTRPDRVPYSIWELVEHIRTTQKDLLEFCVNPDYRDPKWPDDYWPASPGPARESAWNDSLAAFRRDNEALQRFTRGAGDLTAKIPHGTGQTYLRTVLVAVDHTSHHVGQIILVRRLLEAWPPA